MSRKQLHYHSLPIMIVAIALFVVSIMAFSRLETTSTTPTNSLSGLISARLLTIKFTTNGLLKISRYQIQTDQLTSRSQVSGGLAGTIDAGKLTESQLTVYSN